MLHLVHIPWYTRYLAAVMRRVGNQTANGEPAGKTNTLRIHNIILCYDEDDNNNLYIIIISKTVIATPHSWDITFCVIKSDKRIIIIADNRRPDFRARTIPRAYTRESRGRCAIF